MSNKSSPNHPVSHNPVFVSFCAINERLYCSLDLSLLKTAPAALRTKIGHGTNEIDNLISKVTLHCSTSKMQFDDKIAKDVPVPQYNVLNYIDDHYIYIQIRYTRNISQLF